MIVAEKNIVFVQGSDYTHESLMQVLSIDEVSALQYIPRVKRMHWLLGRVAAKRALSSAICGDMSEHIPLCEITILSRKFQAPTYAISHTHALHGQEYHLSLSHAQGAAVACVTPKDQTRGVGIDIEKVRDFKGDVVRAFLTEYEWQSCSNGGEGISSTKATLYWCLKESYLKAIGTGLQRHPRTIEVRNVDDEGGAQLWDQVTCTGVHARWTTGVHDYIMARSFL